MKKLISLNEIRDCLEKGIAALTVDSDTIVTPAAKDYAAEKNIRLVDSCNAPNRPPRGNHSAVSCGGSLSGRTSAIDRELIERIVRQVLKETQRAKLSSPFEKECDPSGLALIRGSSIRCDKFEQAPNANVGLRDILSTSESPNMGAGFMTIEQSRFEWELNYEEMEYIVEGELSVTINGNTYHGRAGDVFYIPKNSKITWSTEGTAKFFYVTYPANWAEIASSKMLHPEV